MLETFEQKVKEFWKDTPAVVVVKEIKVRSQLPKWEDCEKDHIYVGVIRRKRNDRMVVVKHKIEGDFGLNCRAEALTKSDLKMCGIMPSRNPMLCKQCGEFSTRINIDGTCEDCNTKNKDK